MTTATELITQALGILGVRAVGESVDGTTAGETLTRLNSLIDSWRTQKLYAYATQRITGTLPASASTLTVGPTGDIVTTYRPFRLETGGFYNNGGQDYPIQLLTQNEFNGITQKLQASGATAIGIYYEPTLPNGTLYFYPQPSSQVTLTLIVLTELLEFPTLNSDYTLPPGYRRALAYALAEDLAPDYGKTMSPSAVKAGYVALRNIRRVNHATPRLGAFNDYRLTTANDLFTSPANNVFDGGAP